jgi:hypothetical protein
VGQALLQRHEAYVRQHEVYDPKFNRSFSLSDLNLHSIQRKWNDINASHYSQHQDDTTTDSKSTNDDLNLELETLTKRKVQLEKVSIAVIAGCLCRHTDSSLFIAIESSFGQL